MNGWSAVMDTIVLSFAPESGPLSPASLCRSTRCSRSPTATGASPTEYRRSALNLPSMSRSARMNSSPGPAVMTSVSPSDTRPLLWEQFPLVVRKPSPLSTRNMSGSAGAVVIASRAPSAARFWTRQPPSDRSTAVPATKPPSASYRANRGPSGPTSNATYPSSTSTGSGFGSALRSPGSVPSAAVAASAAARIRRRG